MNESYHDIIQPATKICSVCNVEKPLDQFSAQRKGRGGLRSHCKVCASIAFKKHSIDHPRQQRNVPLPPPEGNTSKICTCCSIEKPLTAFSKAKHERFGVRARCKECISEQDRLKRRQNTIPRPPRLPLTARICADCGIEKAIEDFSKVGGNGRYAQYYRGECKDCVLKERSRKHFQKRNAKRVQQPLFIFSRVCTKCGIEKPVEEFQVNKSLRNGVHSRCKVCMAEEVQLRALKIAESVAPSSKPCGKCGIEKPLEDFPVSTGYGKYGRASICSECVSKRFQVNKEKYMATGAKWRKNNPLKDLNRSQRYMARKKNATQIDEINYARILERDGMFCYICEQDILPHHKMHFDHIVPLARGGAHTEGNLTPTHSQCNCRKQDRPFSELTPYDRRGPDA